MNNTSNTQLLCKVGLLALCRRMDISAVIILESARTILDDREKIDVAIALIYHWRGEKEMAIDFLKKTEPNERADRELSRATLGILLKTHGLKGWHEIFGELLASSCDPKVRKISQLGINSELAGRK
jgi:hypothetical protein